MSFNLTGAFGGGNLTLNKAGLAAGTTTTISIANQTDYAIDGTVYRKAAATNAATPTTDANTGKAFVPLLPNQASIFVVLLDAAGNITVAQGPVVSNADLTGGLAAAQFPGVKDGVTAVGYLLAQAGSTLSGSWTFGSSNLSSVTGMTYTFRDVLAIPAHPITG